MDDAHEFELRCEAPTDRPTLDGILYPEITARIEGARRAKARYEAWLARVTPQLEELKERQRLRGLDEETRLREQRWQEHLMFQRTDCNRIDTA